MFTLYSVVTFIAAVLGVNNHQATSTKGGGAGVSVIYGVASPSFN